jgi:hypothetical protein
MDEVRDVEGPGAGVAGTVVVGADADAVGRRLAAMA